MKIVLHIMKNKSLVRALAIIIIFSLALYTRLRFVLEMEHMQLNGDARNYDIMARQFLDKGFLGYMSEEPNAYITPGYPLFLSLIYLISGYQPLSPLLQVRIIQAVIGALTCILLYLIGKQAGNTAIGLISGISCAVYPVFAWSPSLILTETLYSFIFFSYFYLQLIALDSGKRLHSFISGVLFAAAVLVRPGVFPLLIVPFLFRYLTARNLKYLRLFGYTAAGVLITMLPWWIRNVITMGKFILLCTQGGNPLIGGVYPYFANIDYSRFYTGNQTREAVKIILEGLKSDPVLYIKWFTIGKFNLIFGSMWFSPSRGYPLLSSIYLLHYVIVVMGWVGVFFSLLKDRIRLIAVYTVLLTGMQLVFIPESRYAYHIIPFLTVMMSNVLYHLFLSEYAS